MDARGQAGPVETIDLARIMEMIPHRYPMLLVDKVVDVVAGESAVGIKNVTVNEPFFAGHFPGHPIMPGVLIVEAMAQTAAVLAAHAMGGEAGDEPGDDSGHDSGHDSGGKLVYFMAIDSARFRKPVVPGDCLRLTVEKIQGRRNVWKFAGRAEVDGTRVCEAGFTAMIVDR